MAMSMSRILARGYLWAALMVGGGLVCVVVVRVLAFTPLASSRGGDCGTFWRQSELTKYEDAAGQACQDAVTKISVGLLILTLLALALWFAAGWLAVRTRSRRHLVQHAL